MIDGNVKEALDLISVKVHCKNSVSACAGNEICNELCCDRISCLCLSVLSCVAVVRHNNSDACSRCALHSVDHDEDLHQVVVDGIAGRLNDEAVRTSDRLVKRYADLTVGECRRLGFAERQVEAAGDSLSYILACVACKDLDVFTVKIHTKKPLYT